VPDIVMDQSPLLAKADKTGLLREANLPRHLESRNRGAQKDKEKDRDLEDVTPAPGQPSPDISNIKEGELGSDPQLDHALELLKSWQVFKTFVARREG
jgi:hypothetical protein